MTRGMGPVGGRGWYLVVSEVNAVCHHAETLGSVGQDA